MSGCLGLAWLVVAGIMVNPAMMAQAADNALWTQAAQAHEVLWRPGEKS